MSKVLSLRVADDLADWADAYAEKRGTSRTELLVQGLESFRADCETGVPELRQQARAQAALSHDDPNAVGVGDCPKRPGSLGHVWRSSADDPRRSCRFCSRPGRDHEDESGGFFAEATAARSALFSGLRTPASAHGKAPAPR